MKHLLLPQSVPNNIWLINPFPQTIQGGISHLTSVDSSYQSFATSERNKNPSQTKKE